MFFYKRLAYQLFFIIEISLFCPTTILAQDTIALKEVDVVAKKIIVSQIGKKTEAVD